MIMLSSNIALHVLFAVELLQTVTADPYLVIAYDGSSAELGHYSPREHERSMSKRLDGLSSGCFNITGADIQTLPGWSTLSSIAVDSWGAGWFEISTNDPVNDFETLAGPTNACVSSVSQIVYDGQPICNSTTHNSTDHVSGTGSNITLQVIEFKSASTQLVVNSAASIVKGLNLPVTLDLNLDAVNFGTGLPTTQSLTIANTPETSTHFNVTQQQEKPVTFTGKAGQDCNLRYTEQTCAVNGHVQIQMIAHGWVWFDYPDKRQDHGVGDSHWWWALNMDAVLPDEKQRSAYVSLDASITYTARSGFEGVCTGENSNVQPTESEEC